MSLYTPSPITDISQTPCTLEEAKTQLRVDDTFEDDLIRNYIIVATEQAEQILQREIIKRFDDEAVSTLSPNGDIPLTVKQFILCLVGDLYAHRELSEQGTYSTFHKHLLDPYIKYIRKDE